MTTDPFTEADVERAIVAVMRLACVRMTNFCDIHDERYDEDRNCPRAVEIARAALATLTPDAMVAALVKVGVLMGEDRMFWNGLVAGVGRAGCFGPNPDQSRWVTVWKEPSDDVG